MLKDTDKDLTNFQTFRRLWPEISPFKAILMVALVSLIGHAVSEISLVSLIKTLIDNSIGSEIMRVSIRMPVSMLLLFLLRGVSQFTSRYLFAWISSRVVMALRQQVFTRLSRLPVSYFDQRSTATLLSKLIYDVEQVANCSSEALATLVREGVFIIGALCYVFYLSWQLSAILVVVAPVVALVIHHVSKRFLTISKAIQRAMGLVTLRAEQMLKGHKEVLLFGGESVEIDRFSQVNNQMRQQKMKMSAASAAADPITQQIAACALAFVLYLPNFPQLIGSVTPGTFTAVVATMFSLMRPLKSFTSLNSLFQRGMAACQTMFALLDTPSAPDEGKLICPADGGALVFRDVTFTYATKKSPAVKQLNLVINRGATVALVGRSGAGKTTIAHLLTRLYDVDQGAILLADQDIRSYTLDSLRRNIALVSQQIYLFHGTIAENIAYGCEDRVTRQQVEEAASAAHVTDFSATMPGGLDSFVGENGVILSGGQRQRIAIARAVLRKSPILILDEATSALDSESEHLVQWALDNLRKGRTSLVIAHRLSTIEQADKIVVLENGRVVEVGKHGELLAQQERYARWYERQLGVPE